MKIIKELRLDNDRIAFELDEPPNRYEYAMFYEWAEIHGVIKYVQIKNFYRSEMFGDVDYPSIQIEADAPESVETLCKLKWI